jgi:phosphatidylethanolamine-binding protein (PEBP) family uncharacterized protein
MKRWIAVLLVMQAGFLSTMAFGKEVRKMEKLTITSPAFVEGAAMAAIYTCDGDDVSPPLAIGAVPAGTRSLALIMDDPDAPGGMWVHWLVWNIPLQTREIHENKLPAGVKQGRNDWRRTATVVPVLPRGRTDIFSRSMRSTRL